MVVGFCSIESWVWNLRLLAQFLGGEMSPGLFQDFMEGYIRLSPFTIKHSVLVMTGGFQSRQSQIESYEQAIFDSHFY